MTVVAESTEFHQQETGSVASPTDIATTTSTQHTFDAELVDSGFF